MNVKGIGSGKLLFLNENGDVHTARVSEVLFAPKLVGHILSVRKLAKFGFRVEFDENICQIKRDEIQIGIADLKNGVFCLRRPHKVNASIEHKENCIHQWHRKLGHRDPQAIKKMQTDGMVNELVITDCGIEETCETCMKGKMTRLPFPKR